jgi:predicted dehydrogenase
MADLTIIGAGSAARACGEVLERAGFRLRRTFEIEGGDSTPLILGELNGAPAVARQAVEGGRHVMIASPMALTPERLSSLFETRRKDRALFVWSERRYHPAYRFVGSLVETDATWRPRYIRLLILGTEPTASALMRWRALESIALLTGLAADAPLSVSATAVVNTLRNAPDLVSLVLSFKDMEAFIQISLGEAVERREMLFAASERKAFVDELNQSTPLRLVEDEPTERQSSRWVSFPAPTQEELARQQCLAFLESIQKTSLIQDEADVWLRALSALNAVDRSYHANGAAVPVTIREAEPRFRVIAPRGLQRTPPPSVA